MRTIDDLTHKEVINPDVSKGYLYICDWASPEAYATIDNIEKFALDDDDFETVQLYHRWTPEEIAEHKAAELRQEHQELMDSLPDAVADLSEMVSDNTVDTADLMDAIAELSEIISNLMEGK